MTKSSGAAETQSWYKTPHINVKSRQGVRWPEGGE